MRHSEKNCTGNMNYNEQTRLVTIIVFLFLTMIVAM